MTQPKDITTSLSDLNPWDRVYRASGHVVKIKVVELPRASDFIGPMSWRVTGALCDLKGKARPIEGGHFIVEPHEVVDRGQTEIDLIAELEAARLLVVGRVVQAAARETRRTQLPGVLARPAQL